MNVLHKYTLRMLAKNKVRTAVTIIGIILSVAMFTAVTTLISSMHAFFVNAAIEAEGDWHVAGLSMSGEQMEALQQDERVQGGWALENIGYAPLSKVANTYKPYLFVAGMGQDFEANMPVRLTSGRLPENAGEIILPDHLADNGSVFYKLGDEIELVLGERTFGGERLTQRNPLIVNDEETPMEQWEQRETRRFAVVGTYAWARFEDYAAPGYTALTRMDGGGNADYDVYFKLKNIDGAVDFQEKELNSQASMLNRTLLRGYAASGENSLNAVLYSLAAILMGIIFVASVSLIYNAFSISVGERTRQFGLLSSIGATKKQLRASITFEAAVLCLAGVPLGILGGLLGIGITLKLLWPVFAAILGTETGITFALAPSFPALAIAAGMGIITVLVSARIPAKRATSMPAIEAIRQNADVSIRGRDVKGGKLAQRLFGFPGMIARKNFKRSRKKYRATVFSLFMSIVLFISASSFCAYLQVSAEDMVTVQDYEIAYYHSEAEDQRDDVLHRLSSVPGVENSGYWREEYVQLRIPAERLTKEYRAMEEVNNPDLAAESVRTVDAMVIYADRAMYDQLAAEISVQNANGGLVVNRMRIYDSAEERYHVIEIFADVTGSVSREGQEYPLAGAVKTPPIGAGNYGGLRIVYPYTPLSAVEAEEGVNRNGIHWFFKVQDDDKAIHQAMKAELRAMELPAEGLINYTRNDPTLAMITVINVFSYGFIALISLIAAANVFNTISTNIGLRRREFAMLRAIGMTDGEFARMMNYECLMYGLKGLLLGLPAAAGVTWLIYRSVNQGYAASFFIPWQSVALAVASVFGVVFATMIYATRKLRKENTADAMKNENL